MTDRYDTILETLCHGGVKSSLPNIARGIADALDAAEAPGEDAVKVARATFHVACLDDSLDGVAGDAHDAPIADPRFTQAMADLLRECAEWAGHTGPAQVVKKSILPFIDAAFPSEPPESIDVFMEHNPLPDSMADRLDALEQVVAKLKADPRFTREKEALLRETAAWTGWAGGPISYRSIKNRLASFIRAAFPSEPPAETAPLWPEGCLAYKPQEVCARRCAFDGTYDERSDPSPCPHIGRDVP